MSKSNNTICRCCLKVLNGIESRIQTTNKTREIFSNFIGTTLLPGIICSKCNINLLTFDAFQKEIKRKHEELTTIVKIKEEPDNEELIEGIIFGEEDADDDENVISVAELVQTSLEPQKSPESHKSPTGSSDDDDENDVICIPQEPQVPIDIDAISDEPQEAKPDEPKEIIFKCDHCTAVSAKKEVIIQHIKQSHSFKCEACGKVYPKKERLDSHISRVHNAAGGSKRKQSLKPMQTQDQLKFRLKSKPYGRPWPSTLAKRKEEYGY
ncbi:serendipity locus protein delta-like [Chironomus tepperi]|uniref:serendipity locus protein delta-like n=1 Tax=Chironomus tepperi TaxID=113505 RepID=UPI00391F8877